MSIQRLVQGFARNIQQLKAPEYKESQVRLQYIDPFWKLLGWDVSNADQRPPQDVDVLVEPSMDTVEDDGLKSRAPDYLFRISGFPRFVVEAKKPAVHLETASAAIYQAKRYAWNATIPFAILMDFEQFRLYDTTLKPILNEPNRGLVRDFVIDFQDFPAKWEELVATFGREAVAGGALERLRAKIRKVAPTRRLRTPDRMLFELRGDEPVDRLFLDYLEKYRQHFARAVYEDNRNAFPDADTLHGAAKLTEAVQRLMDRLVFMRICEDRGIGVWGGLRETLQRISSEGGDFYASMCADFRRLDTSYNGYLFKYHFSESLIVSGDILADFVRTLYPPDGPWDFSAIGDDILGIVYERFLGHVVTVKRGHATVEEKPEVRHAGGVYYTPRFIVDTIIRRVVGPKIAKKAPVDLLGIKILDPACGSGSFLVAAFQYLIDHCLSAIAADPSLARVPATPKARKKRKDIAFKDSAGRWHLAPDFKASLLTNCIHGVDIDQQAVEVTIMSLYVKMLEGAFPPNWQRDWIENQLLPILDRNILCGNSLIDNHDFDRYLTTIHGDLFPLDEDVRFRVNRFDWDSRMRGFGGLLDQQSMTERGRVGFDCIIGNPPYIRVQELNKWAPDECEFYKFRYESAKKGNYDIYTVFTERGLELLASDGLLGFIMPHKFWQAKYGEGLRKIITDGRHLKNIIDFGDQQVFHGATTYTAVQILSKTPTPKRVDVAGVKKLTDGVTQCLAIDAGQVPSGTVRFTAISPADSQPWFFHEAATQDILAAIRTSSCSLFPEACSAVFQGIVTGADPIFLSSGWAPHLSDKSLIRFKPELSGKFIDIEKAITVPVIRRQGFASFVADAREILLLPYDKNSERLFSSEKMANSFPCAWTYLNEHRRTLAAREKGRFKDQWWCLSRAQNIRRWLGEKILVPYMVNKLQAVYDKTGAFFVNVTTGGYGLELRQSKAFRERDSHALFVVGLLNSRLLDYCMRAISNHFHGGYFPANKQYLQHLPIKLPETTADKKLASRIVESVRAIMDAKAELRGSLSDREKTSLERDVESHEHRIDEAVFELYGVKGLPGQ